MTTSTGPRFPLDIVTDAASPAQIPAAFRNARRVQSTQCKKLLMPAVAFLALSGKARAVESAVSQAPISQSEIATLTQDGVTLHVLRAGIYPFSEIMPSQMEFFEPAKFGARRNFAVWYRLESSRFSDEELSHLEVHGRLLTPTGEILESDGSGDGAIFWNNIKASRGFCPVEISFQLPDTKKRDQGKFSTLMNFKNVPLPQTLNQVVTTERTLEDANGTSVTLYKLDKKRLSFPGFDEVQINAYYRYKTAAPVTEVTFEFAKFVDANGLNLIEKSSGGYRENPEFSLRTGDVSHNAATGDILVRVTKQLPDFIVNKTVRFPFTPIDIQEAPTVSSDAAVATPATLQSSTRSALAQLESWHSNGAVNLVYSWLWLRDLQNNGTSAPQWCLIKGSARDDRGRSSKFWPGGNTPPTSFSGGESAAGYKAVEFSVEVGGNERATKVDLSMQIEPRQLEYHDWEFDASFPAVGQDFTPNQIVQSADGQPLQILRIRRFTSGDALPGYIGTAAQRPQNGVAVVVRWQPTLGDKAEAWANCTSAYDRDGTSWSKLPFGNQIIGDATQTQDLWSPTGKTQTFFFMTPQNVTTLRLHLAAKESIAVGAPETLQFKNVTVPPFSLKP